MVWTTAMLKSGRRRIAAFGPYCLRDWMDRVTVVRSSTGYLSVRTYQTASALDLQMFARSKEPSL